MRLVIKQMSAEKYRHLFDYERDSNAKVLASLQSVAVSLQANPSFQKAIDLMAHLVAARLMWLSRLGFAAKPDALFPSQTALADLPTEVKGARYFAKLLENMQADEEPAEAVAR